MREGEHPYGDKGQVVIFIFYILLLLSDHFFIKTSLIHLNWLRWILALSLFLFSLLLMKEGHNAVIDKNLHNNLITNGVFKIVRHPLYFSILIFYLSLSFAFNSFLGLLMLIPVFLFYNYIASYEEKYLIKKFGDAYTTYQQRTGRWLPKLK